MKRLFIMACAATTLAASAVPANAQLGFNLNGEQGRLQAKIDAGIRSGSLSRGDAGRLENKLVQINQLEMRMQGYGNRLSWHDRQKLQNRLNDLNADLNRDFNRSCGGGFRHIGWR
jgi:hypothetical protein